MTVRNRLDLKNRILEDLGAPLVQVNITDKHLENAIDKTIEWYRKWVLSGRYEDYMAVPLHATEITYSPTQYGSSLTKADLGRGRGIEVRNILEEGEEGEQRSIRSYTELEKENDRESRPGFLITHGMNRGADGENLFQIGEELFFKGANDDEAFGIITDINFGPIDLRYIDLPPEITEVTEIHTFADANSTQSVFDLNYQLRLHDLYDLTSASVIYFNTVMNHLSLLDWLFNGTTQHNFEYREGKLKIYSDWDNDFVLGEYIVLKSYRMTINNQTKEPIIGYDKEGNALFKSRLKSKVQRNGSFPLYSEEGYFVRDIHYSEIMNYRTVKEEIFRQAENMEIIRGDVYVNESKTAKWLQFDDNENRLTENSPGAVIMKDQPITDLKEIQMPPSENDNPRAWADEEFIALCVANTKIQWGSNLKKYGTVNLPGGITLKGQEIYDEGMYEQKLMQKELRARERPLAMSIG